MTAINSGLKEIHDLREKLEQLTSQIEKGPRQVQARQKTVDSKKLELESLRSKLKHLKVGSEQKNLQLKSYEGRIHDLEGKLNSVSSNREYDALGNQIAADKMANSVLEDEIIEALEGIDKMQSEIVAFENELITVELERTAFGNTVTQKEPELRRQIEELQIVAVGVPEKAIRATAMRSDPAGDVMTVVLYSESGKPEGDVGVPKDAEPLIASDSGWLPIGGDASRAKHWIRDIVKKPTQ